MTVCNTASGCSHAAHAYFFSSDIQIAAWSSGIADHMMSAICRFFAPGMLALHAANTWQNYLPVFCGSNLVGHNPLAFSMLWLCSLWAFSAQLANSKK